MSTVVWVIVAVVIANLFFVFGCWWASRRNEDLEQALRCKKAVWCDGCSFRLDAKGFDELLLYERKSKFALLRERDKTINELRGKLYAVTRQQGIEDFNTTSVARG